MSFVPTIEDDAYERGFNFAADTMRPELERLRAENEALREAGADQRYTDGYWRSLNDAVKVVIELRDAEIKALRATVETLRSEVAENDGVIAVWRRRANDAEAQVEALRAEVTELGVRLDEANGLLGIERDTAKALRIALDRYRGQVDRFGNHSAADALGEQRETAE